MHRIRFGVTIRNCALLLSALLLARGHAEEFVSGRLSGRVTDSLGKPLAGAKVEFNRITDAALDMNAMRTPAITDANGYYELPLRFAKGRTAVIREVFAEKKGYVRSAPPLNIPLHEGETAELSFSLTEGKVVSGIIKEPLRPDGERTARHLIFVSGPGIDKLVQNGRVYLTEPGTSSFEFYLPPGEFTLKIHQFPRQEPLEWKGISPGQTGLVLELPPIEPPKPFSWTKADLAQAFDQFHTAMDLHYSYFFLKTNVDWGALKEKYRPEALDARNADELAKVLQNMLAPLHDLHVWIETPSGDIPTYRSSYRYNGNYSVMRNRIENQTECGPFAMVAKVKEDGFGCFVLLNQGEANDENVAQAVEAIKKLGDAPGFLVDLRNANGGSEPLAAKVASLFSAKETVYARSKYRNGPGHEDFTEAFDRTLPASTNAYTKPVVCLIGPGAVSSGEGFVQMMRALPNVTTVGLPTRGASGNPNRAAIGLTGVGVYFSRWVDLLPDGEVFEGKGISPAVRVDEPATSSQDPTLEKGLEILREKTGVKSSTSKVQAR